MNQSMLSIKTELMVYMSISFIYKKIYVKEFGSHDCGECKLVGQASRLETQTGFLLQFVAEFLLQEILILLFRPSPCY